MDENRLMWQHQFDNENNHRWISSICRVSEPCTEKVKPL